MATATLHLDVASARFRSTNAAATVKANGTTVPVLGIAFDAAADEEAHFSFRISNYGSGNVFVRIAWYADTAASGNVVFGVALGAITSGDPTNIETKALGTEATTAVAAESVAQAMSHITIQITSIDSIADGDFVFVRLRRLGTNGSDTMAGDAIVVALELNYSDT